MPGLLENTGSGSQAAGSQLGEEERQVTKQQSGPSSEPQLLEAASPATQPSAKDLQAALECFNPRSIPYPTSRKRAPQGRPDKSKWATGHKERADSP